METPDIDKEDLLFYQKLFIRLKGFHEGMYKGFYRNMLLEKQLNEDECLGKESFESLDMVVKTYNNIRSGTSDIAQDMMGLTAFMRILFDNS